MTDLSSHQNPVILSDNEKVSYLRMDNEFVGNPPECGIYMTRFLRNVHPSRGISVEIIMNAVYMGRIENTEKETHKVYPGTNKRIKLGCNGFDNPAGYDTLYERTYGEATWIDKK